MQNFIKKKLQYCNRMILLVRKNYSIFNNNNQKIALWIIKINIEENVQEDYTWGKIEIIIKIQFDD